MDDVLLDHFFNPVTWWIEYNFGRNAMDVRIAMSYIGMTIVLLLAVLERSYFVFFLVGVLWTLLSFFGEKVIRANWQRNNKTGKNINRIYGFPSRRINDLLVLYWIIIPSGDVLNYILGIVGWATLLVVCGYLDATDSLPPHYREFKTVPQT